MRGRTVLFSMISSRLSGIMRFRFGSYQNRVFNILVSGLLLYVVPVPAAHDAPAAGPSCCPVAISVMDMSLRCLLLSCRTQDMCRMYVSRLVWDLESEIGGASSLVSVLRAACVK